MEIFRPFSFDKWLFLVMLALIGVGIIMVFSSSGVLASEKYHQPFYFLVHQIIGVSSGLILILFIIQIRKPFYQNPYFVYGLLFLTFVLLAMCFLMPSMAKTNRWVQSFGIRFQPSELAKISLILFFAYYLDRKREKLNELRTLLVPLGALFLTILLILKEPDFGTALLIFIICAILLFIAGVKLKYFSYLGIFSLVLFGFYLFQASYRVDRIAGFLSPANDPLGKSFQVIQSKMAVGSGGLLGVSIGESTQKLFFLPCAHTDFIFAILGEELGLLGTLGTLTLFAILLWRGVVIFLRAPSFSGQLAAAGFTLMITIQALLNISVVLGMGPAKGVPLPLISFGRSSLVCNLMAIGMLLNISQRKSLNGKKRI
jgi:cell division protein FtsW